jgi:hypothetical protein
LFTKFIVMLAPAGTVMVLLSKAIFCAVRSTVTAEAEAPAVAEAVPDEDVEDEPPEVVAEGEPVEDAVVDKVVVAAEPVPEVVLVVPEDEQEPNAAIAVRIATMGSRYNLQIFCFFIVKPPFSYLKVILLNLPSSNVVAAVTWFPWTSM